jgi:hypothetical protein
VRGDTKNQGNYDQKRLDRALRNHLTTIRALAQTCKLGPALQIHIAEKPINTVAEPRNRLTSRGG